MDRLDLSCTLVAFEPAFRSIPSSFSFELSALSPSARPACNRRPTSTCLLLQHFNFFFFPDFFRNCMRKSRGEWFELRRCASVIDRVPSVHRVVHGEERIRQRCAKRKRRYNVSNSDFCRFCTTSNSYILQTIRLTIIAKLYRCNTFLTASIHVFTFASHQPHEALCYFKVSCFCTYSTFLILISHKPLLNFNIANCQHVPLYLPIPTPPPFHLGTNHKRRYNVSKSNFFRF